MEIEQFNEFTDEYFDEPVTIREATEKYLIHIKWFIFSVILFGVLTFFKLKYEVPMYNVKASIMINEKERGNSFAELSSFEDMGLIGLGENSLENEIQILKSRRLIKKVVEELKLNIRYFIDNYPYDLEQYPNFPVVINFKSDLLTVGSISTSFEIIVKSNNKFEFIGFNDVSYGEKVFGEEFTVDLGNEEVSDKRLITIGLNENLGEDIKGKKIKITISAINEVVNNFMDRLIIEPIDSRLSEVLVLSIDDHLRQRGAAFINNLIDQYNADGINDKNLLSQVATNFLDERLGLLSAEISAIESTAAQFKINKGLIGGNMEANYYFQSSTVAESEIVYANTQKQLVNHMLEELNSSSLTELLPSNIGLSDSNIASMISEYNNLILQRNRILKSSSTLNPIIVNIDSELNILRDNLLSSLKTLRSSSQIQIDALNRKSGRIGSKIASAPKYEKEFKDIVREQDTKNALYLFLLQKREESILSNAVKINKAKIIDSSYSSGVPISPKRMLAYIGSIILGLIIPFLIIYVKDLFDNKIYNENDIKKLKLPYLGDIPLSSSKQDVFISDIDDSNIAESFRYLRTNINFMLDNKSKGKTVFVTSTRGHEGKTFTSINLAFSLAISGKKTLLLGMDLRAPKITKYLNLGEMLGVTNFIKDDELKIIDILEQNTQFEDLHLINSGDIPPNPVELLMSKRVTDIFDYAKDNYEYIIVDTAPVGMVTDTIQISRFADITIYVIKANYLDKRMLHIPEKLNKENKLPNMAFLINGTDNSKGAYGYGYGYSNKRKKKWYKKIFDSAAI